MEETNLYKYHGQSHDEENQYYCSITGARIGSNDGFHPTVSGIWLDSAQYDNDVNIILGN